MAENQIKFGFLDLSDIYRAIEQGTISAYSICYSKDTHEQFLVKEDLTLLPIRNRLKIYMSVDIAIDSINQDSSCYAGELVSIYDSQKDVFVGYIINQFSDGRLYVSPLSIQQDVDYNSLTNVPITNVTSSVVNKVNLADLSNGTYKINYFNTPDGQSVNSLVGNIVIVESDLFGKNITRISQKEIIYYNIVNGIVTTEKYITDKYLEQQGYVTSSEVDIQIQAFDYVTQTQLIEYVTTTVQAIVKQAVSDELDLRYCVDSDISDLFD